MPWALLAAMAVVGLLRSASIGIARTFFNVYLDESLGLPTATVGTLYATAQVLSTPGPLLTPWLVSKIGNRRTVILGTSLVAVSTLLLAFVRHPLAATVGRMGMSGFSSLGFAALSVFQMELVRPRWRSTLSAANTMARGTSWALLSLIGGYIITGVGYQALFLLGAALSGAGAVFFWLYFRRPRGEYTRQGRDSRNW
jgi:predicted MFS family arabinose efflux permease